MENARAYAQQHHRIEESGQEELFGGEVLSNSSYVTALRARYMDQAAEQVRYELSDKKRILYDDAWSIASRFPLVWESDLRRWLKQRRSVRSENLSANQRVPKCRAGHLLTWSA